MNPRGASSSHGDDARDARARRLSGLQAHQHPGRNVRAIADLERSRRARRSATERVACRVAEYCGTAGFLWSQAAIFAAWIIWNSWPGVRHVDPFPYIFLTLVLSIEAIFLSVFILISQNEETRRTERRNALDLQINLLAEQESTEALRMLRHIGEKLGVRFDDEPDIDALQRATRPEILDKQIGEITQQGSS
ncbi:MAG TPA: DUF1003 domain-containing protein [Burkholderiaceae bacterium]|nr:DUF1003 domain-containing protein [Burkholderiaceae bacterium]